MNDNQTMNRGEAVAEAKRQQGVDLDNGNTVGPLAITSDRVSFKVTMKLGSTIREFPFESPEADLKVGDLGTVIGESCAFEYVGLRGGKFRLKAYGYSAICEYETFALLPIYEKNKSLEERLSCLRFNSRQQVSRLKMALGLACEKVKELKGIYECSECEHLDECGVEIREECAELDADYFLGEVEKEMG